MLHRVGFLGSEKCRFWPLEGRGWATQRRVYVCPLGFSKVVLEKKTPTSLRPSGCATGKKQLVLVAKTGIFNSGKGQAPFLEARPVLVKVRFLEGRRVGWWGIGVGRDP